MNLILNIVGFRFLLYESHDFFEFLVAAGLKPRGIMEDKLWVALEAKLDVDIMDSSLQCRIRVTIKRKHTLVPLRLG